MVIYLFLIINLFSSVRGYVNKGNKFYKKRNYEKAENLYKKGLKEKEHPYIYYNLGNLYYRMNEYDKAIENYKKAVSNLKNRKKLAKVFYNLGNAYFKKQDFKNAVKYWRKSLKINPKDEDAKHNLELTLRFLKKKKGQGKKREKGKEKKGEEEKRKREMERAMEQILKKMEEKTKKARKRIVPKINVEKDW